MAYDKYLTEKVFADDNVNITCNNMMQWLEDIYGAGTLNTKFGLTGTVAKIIQGDPLSEVPVIAYAVQDATWFQFIKNNITSVIITSGVAAFEDRLQVSAHHANIEIWLREDPITLIDTNGIFSEDKTEIPVNIL